MIKNVKNTVSKDVINMLLRMLIIKNLLKRFRKKNFNKKYKNILNWKSNKGDKFYVKWKGYNNSFNSRVD